MQPKDNRFTTKKDASFDGKLLAEVRELDRSSPAVPHRHFVRAVIRRVHELTGQIHAESWYRRLIQAAGSERRPSTRTVNTCVISIKDDLGEGVGTTQVVVRQLRRQFADLQAAVGRVEALVSKVAEVAARQAAISEAIDKRQMLFSDQAQVYQRQIDQLTKIVEENLKASREVTRNANDVALGSARLIRDLQGALQAFGRGSAPQA